MLLPKGVEFADLEMELVPDDANDGKATLNYTYEGHAGGDGPGEAERSVYQ